MKAVIDRAGRIVVPKPLRQALGLRPGQPLEIRAGDGRLEIEIASTPMQLRKRGKGLVAVKKLVDEFQLDTMPGRGTTVTCMFRGER